MNNYSNSKCPKCENNTFELTEDSPKNSKYKMQFLRCCSCKTIITTLPFYDTTSILESIEKDLEKIKSKLGIY